MSTAAASAPSKEPQAPLGQACDEQHNHDVDVQMKDNTKEDGASFLHSPPDSHDAPKSDATDSELSDLEDEAMLDDMRPIETATEDTETKPDEDEDIGEVLPADWSGAVPIFRPTMHQFKDFQKFMAKVDCYGMKSGIIKIIPPPEWKDAQPPLDDLVKQVRVREPIKQDIMGSNGTYRQVNILHGRSYNVPQWRQLCDQSEHQPPARRGERRANADKRTTRSKPATAPKTSEPSAPKKRGKGRPAKGRGGRKSQTTDAERPMTPVSPKLETSDEAVASIEKDPGEDIEDGEPAAPRRMGAVKAAKPAKTTSVSARRKYVRREGSAMIDEEAFKNFDYKLDTTEYTPERCEELERSYWKTLTYAQPLYGADMMGTLFDDRTDIWNLNKLPNILDVLGTKVPGVNTAYLYLGMWKATFAWHLEDVDLYSINYLHFGAPKQWYSISQADARRFEGAMKNIWPADAKACPQFLRHKGFLISPQHLLQNYNIKVNKVVSYPGEFVVTYPYGYHSGYNLGYNCAEAVNFALEPWLEMGKIAKKCECAQAQDSVWIDVHAIERKLRGWETEYEETDEEEEESEEEDEEDPTGIPTPPAAGGVKFKSAPRKRKRATGEKGSKVKVKKIKLKLKSRAEPPCCLCPNDYPGLDLLTTDDGRKAHRTCALYIPETYIDTYEGEEVVCGTAHIHKDRLNLKCLFCRSKRGACFQCSQKKCARSYHASCAAAAGVFVEEQDVPVFGEDGTEYKEQAFEFSCRFHRTRRDRKLDSLALEDDTRIRDAATALKVGEMCQMQYFKGEIFAGLVVENRADEDMLVIDTVPHGQRLEVEYKWLLLADPSDYHLPKASANAIPMPVSQKAKDKLNAKRADDKPRKDDIFAIGYTWAEYNDAKVSNKAQINIDFSKPEQIWHYLGKTSTEAKAQYTEDPRRPRHNIKANFLDTVPKPPPKPRPVSAAQMHYRQYQYSAQATAQQPPNHGYNAAMLKPYVYKPREGQTQYQSTQYTNQQFSARPVAPSAQAPKAAPRAAPVAPPSRVWNNYNGSFAQSKESGQTKQAHPIPAQHHPTAVSQPQAQRQPTQHPVQQAQKAQNKPAYQIHPGVYQQYPYYQQNYNRDTARYRSPYSPAGGFTNGWEINPNMHTTPAQPTPQQQQQQRPAAQTVSPKTQSSAPEAAPVSQSAPSSTQRQPHSQTWKQQPAPATQTPVASPASSGPKTSGSFKTAQSNNSLPFKSTKPTAASSAPMKQSPVPLPPNFLARITTQSPNSSPTPQTAPPFTGKITSQTPIPPPAARVAQQQAAASPETAGQQKFPDVPGGGSMEFVERLMGNLKKASQRT